MARTSDAADSIERVQRILHGIRGHAVSDEHRAGIVLEIAEGLADAARADESMLETQRRTTLGRLVADTHGKAFTVALADQLHRPLSDARLRSQVLHLVERYGLPAYLPPFARTALERLLTTRFLPDRLVRSAILLAMRAETHGLVHDASRHAVDALVRARDKDEARVTLNVLGEAVLGDAEASARLERYVELLASTRVDAISVKISSIASQRSALAHEWTVAEIVPRLARLYDAALARPRPARVTLDMEGYEDVEPTFDAYRRTLAYERFDRLDAGLVIQAYLPDAHSLADELDAFAARRIGRGGAPCRVRLVKGANLAMERHQASVSGHALPTYGSKAEVDASFARLVDTMLTPERTRRVRVGVGSHNVFDLAHAIVLEAERDLGDGLEIEMLDGMADPLRRAVTAVAPSVAVYAPIVDRADYGSAVAYLVRRLDENTAPENHLARSFSLEVASGAWNDEAERFVAAMKAKSSVSTERRRKPRDTGAEAPSLATSFRNEVDSDFEMPEERRRVLDAIARKADAGRATIGSLVRGVTRGGKEVDGFDPSRPGVVPYRIQLAFADVIDDAIVTANESRLAKKSPAGRAAMLAELAQALRSARDELVATIVLDVGKRAIDADAEVSEAIDFAEYYARSLLELSTDPTLRLSPRGTTVVLSPWNFPLSIAVSGVCASLAAGNAVVLKPAPEAPLVAHRFVSLAHAAGVPEDALALVLVDDSMASRLVTAHGVDLAVLTGSTETARTIRRLRPSLPLYGETGGKNPMIVTAMSDRDLAIHDAVRSAFGYGGQKCSATSRLVCEREVYEDRGFLERLVDATRSLVVGSAYHPASFVTPLIRPPDGPLARALATLDAGESWLLEPRIDRDNPRLVHPGLRYGVRPGSFAHDTELFGPVLSIVCADDFEDALRIANATPYGLTAGLESLDPREHERFVASIRAGNVYVNRTTTGALVRRQPFGGFGASRFGPGVKTGGPNTVLSHAKLADGTRPAGVAEPSERVLAFVDAMNGAIDIALRDELLAFARADAKELVVRYHVAHDPDALPTQRNELRYVNAPGMFVGIGADAATNEIFREALAQVATSGSFALARLPGSVEIPIPALARTYGTTIDLALHASAESLAAAFRDHEVSRLRVLGAVDDIVHEAAAHADVFVDASGYVSAPRAVLRHSLDEQALSIEVHRYGNPI